MNARTRSAARVIAPSSKSWPEPVSGNQPNPAALATGTVNAPCGQIICTRPPPRNGAMPIKSWALAPQPCSAMIVGCGPSPAGSYSVCARCILCSPPCARRAARAVLRWASRREVNSRRSPSLVWCTRRWFGVSTPLALAGFTGSLLPSSDAAPQGGRMKLLLFDLDGTILHARHTAGHVPFDLAMRDVFGVDVALRRMRPDGKTDPRIVAELLV